MGKIDKVTFRHFSKGDRMQTGYRDPVTRMIHCDRGWSVHEREAENLEVIPDEPQIVEPHPFRMKPAFGGA